MTTTVFPTGDTGMEWARALSIQKSGAAREQNKDIYIY